MPRPRKFDTNAERQAAYRHKVYWQQPPTQKFLAGMAEGFHRELAEAIERGNCPLPSHLLGQHAGQTLANLRVYLLSGQTELLVSSFSEAMGELSGK